MPSAPVRVPRAHKGRSCVPDMSPSAPPTGALATRAHSLRANGCDSNTHSALPREGSRRWGDPPVASPRPRGEGRPTGGPREGACGDSDAATSLGDSAAANTASLLTTRPVLPAPTPTCHTAAEIVTGRPLQKQEGSCPRGACRILSPCFHPAAPAWANLVCKQRDPQAPAPGPQPQVPVGASSPSTAPGPRLWGALTVGGSV